MQKCFFYVKYSKIKSTSCFCFEHFYNKNKEPNYSKLLYSKYSKIKQCLLQRHN